MRSRHLGRLLVLIGALAILDARDLIAQQSPGRQVVLAPVAVPTLEEGPRLAAQAVRGEPAPGGPARGLQPLAEALQQADDQPEDDRVPLRGIERGGE